jgi:DNA-binding NtrC family response regulator
MYKITDSFREAKGAPLSILIVDDDEVICEILTTYLRPRGYQIRLAHTGAGAIDALHDAIPDVVILDLRLPDMQGQDIMHRIREMQLESEVIIITGFASLDSALDAIKSGAFDYIVKPFKLGEIEISVRNAMDRIHLRKQNRILGEKVRELSRRLEKAGLACAVPTIRFEESQAPPHSTEGKQNPLAAYGEPADRKAKTNT